MTHDNILSFLMKHAPVPWGETAHIGHINIEHQQWVIIAYPDNRSWHLRVEYVPWRLLNDGTAQTSCKHFTQSGDPTEDLVWLKMKL